MWTVVKAPATEVLRGVLDEWKAVAYRILETRRPTEELVLGYVRADFTFPDGATVSLNLGMPVTRADSGWRILHYQASPAV